MFKIIFSFLLFGSAVGLFIGFISPTYDSVRDTQILTDRYDKALVKTREIQELKRSLLSRFNIFSGPNIDRLQKLLPDHVDNVRLVLDIDGIASKYGIRIANVEVETGGKKKSENETTIIGSSDGSKDYQSLILRFDITATYENMINFMRDLESSLRITDLVSMQMTRVDGAKSQSHIDGEDVPVIDNVYKMNIAIKTYWLNK